jgi:hypothetical protein
MVKVGMDFSGGSDRRGLVKADMPAEAIWVGVKYCCGEEESRGGKESEADIRRRGA